MGYILDDIAQKLADSGLGTIGTNIYKSYLPDTVDNGFAVIDTGGVGPDPEITGIHNPTFQIFLRAPDYITGKAKLDAIRLALHGIVNTTLGNTFFYFIHAQSEGGSIGKNERGLDEFSINFIAKTR